MFFITIDKDFPVMSKQLHKKINESIPPVEQAVLFATLRLVTSEKLYIYIPFLYS
jgi:hypothetical protein